MFLFSYFCKRYSIYFLTSYYRIIFVVNFCKNFFANFRLFSPAQDAVFVNLIYIIDQWKSNVQFFITAPCWQQFFREVLRCLTSIKLFLNPDYHGKHCYFDLAFNSQKDKIRSLHYFFVSV